MYPASFRYHRAGSLSEASTMLAELGEEAKPLAGGQSLIPLMKLRLATPADLVDLNFVPDLDSIARDGGSIRFGPLVRHARIAAWAGSQGIPILQDCAAGIADPQVRSRGTIAGSVAEADPSGDWTPVLMALSAQVSCLGPKGEERTLAIDEFVQDAYTTALGPAELVSQVIVPDPPEGSGGAYLAFKRSAQVYATASVAAQLETRDGLCVRARIVLGSAGMTAVAASQADQALAGRPIDDKALDDAAEAAQAAAQPISDVRGSAEYKRTLLGSLVKRAVERAARRSRGEEVQGGHEYV